jgi:hypothetical protein
VSYNLPCCLDPVAEGRTVFEQASTSERDQNTRCFVVNFTTAVLRLRRKGPCVSGYDYVGRE